MYVIVDCPRCRRFFIKETRRRSVLCPYCGARVRLKPGRYLIFNNLEDARRKLAEMRG